MQPDRFRALRTVRALAILTAVAACGGGSDGGTHPPVPAALTAVTATSLAAAAGGSITPAPAVKVTDASGSGVAGVVVTFSAASGGGTVSGAQRSTDASGVAAVGGWTVGTTPGTAVLTASAAGLPSVSFSATVTAGPAAAVSKVAGDGQSAVGGSILPIAPSVRVADAYGNPVAGAMVVFGVTAGGGAITGASATTAADGRAALGSWTLGEARNGDVANSLTATVASLPPVAFTATALDPCGISTPYTLFATVSGQLSSLDCRYTSNEYVDFYSTTVGAAQLVELTQSSTALDSYLLLTDATGLRIAANNDGTPGQPNARVRAILLPGTYTIEATSNLADVTGAYTLSSAAGSSTITNCDLVFVSPSRTAGDGIVANQHITATDCVDSYGYYSDAYLMAFHGSTPVTISMTSPDFYIALAVFAPDGSLVAYTDDYNSASTSVTFTPTQDGFYYIYAGTYFSGVAGAYTITFP